MPKLPIVFSTIFFALVFSTSCKSVYQSPSVKYAGYRLNQNNTKGSNIPIMPKPYAGCVNNNKNDVFTTAPVTFQKKQQRKSLNLRVQIQ